MLLCRVNMSLRGTKGGSSCQDLQEVPVRKYGPSLLFLPCMHASIYKAFVVKKCQILLEWTPKFCWRRNLLNWWADPTWLRPNCKTFNCITVLSSFLSILTKGFVNRFGSYNNERGTAMDRWALLPTSYSTTERPMEADAHRGRSNCWDLDSWRKQLSSFCVLMFACISDVSRKSVRTIEERKKRKKKLGFSHAYLVKETQTK